MCSRSEHQPVESGAPVNPHDDELDTLLRHRGDPFWNLSPKSTAREASGVDLLMGEARFVAPKTVAVGLNDGGARTITGARIILSVGTPRAATTASLTEVPCGSSGRAL